MIGKRPPRRRAFRHIEVPDVAFGGFDGRVPQVLRDGVPVSISTDDPGIFGVTLTDEIQICLNSMSMSPAEIKQCENHAARASFIGR